MGNNLNSIVFQPPQLTYSYSRSPIISLRTTSGSKVAAFHIDNQSTTTILFSHGNAEDIGNVYEWFLTVGRELGVNILAYDYDGYGKSSPASPSEKGCYECIDAAFAFLVDKEQVLPSNIVLYGRSLGCGPTIYLAERLSREKIRLGGIILQSAFMSIFRVVFPFRFTLPFDMFPNIDRISRIQCPILMIHGTRDEVVPFWNGEDLFLNAPIQWRAKPFWIIGGGHNNLEFFFRDNGIFIDQIRSFFITWVPSYVPTLKSRRTSFESNIAPKKKEKHHRRFSRKDSNSYQVVANDVL